MFVGYPSYLQWYWQQLNVNCKVPIITAADNILFLSLDISYESSAKQMIHMKCQDLFFLKDKK